MNKAMGSPTCRFFTGNPTNQSFWLLLCAIASTIFGHSMGVAKLETEEVSLIGVVRCEAAQVFPVSAEISGLLPH